MNEKKDEGGGILLSENLISLSGIGSSDIVISESHGSRVTGPLI